MFLLTKSFGKPLSWESQPRRRFHISQTMPCWQKAFQSRGSPKINRKKLYGGFSIPLLVATRMGRLKSCFRCCYDLGEWELPVAGCQGWETWHGDDCILGPKQLTSQGYDTLIASTSSELLRLRGRVFKFLNRICSAPFFPGKMGLKISGFYYPTKNPWIDEVRWSCVTLSQQRRKMPPFWCQVPEMEVWTL